MRRALGATATLLVLGGFGLFLFGMFRVQWLMYAWSEDRERIAETMCRPGETFTVMRRRRIGGKTSYYWYCVDAAGHRRNPSDEVDATSPMRQASTWAPPVAGIAAFLVGLAAARVATRLPERRRARQA